MDSRWSSIRSRLCRARPPPAAERLQAARFFRRQLTWPKSSREDLVGTPFRTSRVVVRSNNNARQQASDAVTMESEEFGEVD